MPPPVFRFAPSPNGYLHLGHAYSALLNFELAKQSGGIFLLRIEDIDGTRCRPAFEEAIYEDLSWLEISWQEPVRRQSEHLQVYRDAITRLTAKGLIYPAFESRAEIVRLASAAGMHTPWPHDPDGAPVYAGCAKHMPQHKREEQIRTGMSYALRLDMDKALKAGNSAAAALSWVEDGRGPNGEAGEIRAQPTAWGDVVLARKETPTSYHISVVCDDAVQGVTHVVRGHDLFWATSVHRLLQDLLGLPAPRYRHHDLIRDDAGHKLSKSNVATSIRELRAAGVTVADIRQRIGLPAV